MLQTAIENYRKEVETLRDTNMEQMKLLTQYEQKLAKLQNVDLLALLHYCIYQRQLFGPIAPKYSNFKVKNNNYEFEIVVFFKDWAVM